MKIFGLKNWLLKCTYHIEFWKELNNRARNLISTISIRRFEHIKRGIQREEREFLAVIEGIETATGEKEEEDEVKWLHLGRFLNETRNPDVETRARIELARGYKFTK